MNITSYPEFLGLRRLSSRDWQLCAQRSAWTLVDRKKGGFEPGVSINSALGHTNTFVESMINPN